MKTKFFFITKDDELCYDIDYVIEFAKDEGLEQIEVYKAIPYKIDGYFYCKLAEAVGENGSCGEFCDDYSPRNGKTGICKYRSNIFYKPGEKVIIKIEK